MIMPRVTLTPLYEDILFLRKLVLRPGAIDLSQCEFPGDLDPSSFHIGTYLENAIISIATFHQERFAKEPNRRGYRLRGMATHPDFASQGYGTRVLMEGIEELRKRKCELLWFNSRKSAVPFYQRLDFKVDSGEFELPHTGPHFLMYRNIF